jgi:hypothetical protein
MSQGKSGNPVLDKFFSLFSTSSSQIFVFFVAFAAKKGTFLMETNPY